MSVLQRTRTAPKERQVGKCKKSLERMGFPFLCLNCSTSWVWVCAPAVLWLSWVRHCNAPAPFILILVFLGRTPAGTGRRHLRHALTGMQIWIFGAVAVGHTADEATLESRSSLSIYTRGNACSLHTQV